MLSLLLPFVRPFVAVPVTASFSSFHPLQQLDLLGQLAALAAPSLLIWHAFYFTYAQLNFVVF